MKADRYITVPLQKLNSVGAKTPVDTALLIAESSEFKRLNSNTTLAGLPIEELRSLEKSGPSNDDEIS